MSEESLRLMKVVRMHVEDIWIQKPDWWIDLSAEYRIPIPLECEHFRSDLRKHPNDSYWAVAYADQIVMVAISVAYQALVRQRLLFLRPNLRGLVTSILPDCFEQDSSVAECNVHKLWDMLDSDVWRACPHMKNRRLAFNSENMHVDLKEVPVNGVGLYLQNSKMFLNNVRFTHIAKLMARREESKVQNCNRKSHCLQQGSCLSGTQVPVRGKESRRDVKILHE